MRRRRKSYSLRGLKSFKRKVKTAEKKLKEVKAKERQFQKNLSSLKKLMRKRGFKV